MPKQNGNPKILAAGAAVQLLTGIPAAWGVFQKPVMAQYGFSRGQAMLSFAITTSWPCAVLTVPSTFGVPTITAM